MQYRISDLIDLPGSLQVMQAWYSVAGVATALLGTDRTSLCAAALIPNQALPDENKPEQGQQHQENKKAHATCRQ